MLAYVPESYVEVQDHVKRELPLLTGILLTEVGATATRRLTWPAIGRYFVCGGGLFSSMLYAQMMIWNGKRKAGYQLSMASALGTTAAAFALNFNPVWRVTIAAGSSMVFIGALNRYNNLKRRAEE